MEEGSFLGNAYIYMNDKFKDFMWINVAFHVVGSPSCLKGQMPQKKERQISVEYCRLESNRNFYEQYTHGF